MNFYLQKKIIHEISFYQIHIQNITYIMHRLISYVCEYTYEFDNTSWKVNTAFSLIDPKIAYILIIFLLSADFWGRRMKCLHNKTPSRMMNELGES